MERHPWEVAIETVKKKGLPVTPDNVRRFLSSHGYYTEVGGKRTLIRDRPYIIAVHPDLFSILAGKVRWKRYLTKPVAYIPEADIRLDASVVAYNVAKEMFGNRLKAFAVVGGTLTPNIAGVPVKVRPIEVATMKGTRLKERKYAGLIDDLDLAIVVERVTPEEQDRFVRRFYEEIGRRGLPRVVLDTSQRFIFDPEDYERVAHYFHRQRPKAFFEGRKFVQRLLREMMKHPTAKTLLRDKEREYTRKLKIYNHYFPNRLLESFYRAVKELKEKRT